jgi:hypothetical protein
MKSSDPVGLTEFPISKEVVFQLFSHIPSDLILFGGQQAGAKGLMELK